VAFGCACGRELGHEGPAAVEGIVRIEVRVAGQDLPLAVAEELLGHEALRQQLGDIRFDNLALMRLPAGDERCADEGALGAGDGEIGILCFELNRLRQFGNAFGQKNRRGRVVTAFACGAHLFERLGQCEGRGDLYLQGVGGGECEGKKEKET
jgi:hypothetical protein